MRVDGTEASATLERNLNGRVEMNQIGTLLMSEGAVSRDEVAFADGKPESGYTKSAHIVEWHVQSDTDDMAEGSLDGCGSCGCGGCGGCFITQ